MKKIHEILQADSAPAAVSIHSATERGYYSPQGSLRPLYPKCDFAANPEKGLEVRVD